MVEVQVTTFEIELGIHGGIKTKHSNAGSASAASYFQFQILYFSSHIPRGLDLHQPINIKLGKGFHPTLDVSADPKSGASDRPEKIKYIHIGSYLVVTFEGSTTKRH